MLVAISASLVALTFDVPLSSHWALVFLPVMCDAGVWAASVLWLLPVSELRGSGHGSIGRYKFCSLLKCLLDIVLLILRFVLGSEIIFERAILAEFPKQNAFINL